MDSIWMGISPEAMATRLIAMRGPAEPILKARLRCPPSSPRALEALLESVALWEGAPVRAALVVDEQASFAQGTSYREVFPIFGDSALYDVQWVPRARSRRRRRDELRGMGRFRDLEQLLLHNVAR